MTLLYLAQKDQLKTRPPVVIIQTSSSNQRRTRVLTHTAIENYTPLDCQLSASLENTGWILLPLHLQRGCHANQRGTCINTGTAITRIQLKQRDSTSPGSQRPTGRSSHCICNVVVTRISAERRSESGQLLPELNSTSVVLFHLAHQDRLYTSPIVLTG